MSVWEHEVVNTIDKLDVVKAGDYEVPLELVTLTGCPPHIFESYGSAQFNHIQRELAISHRDNVLEIGCGVGRLAIPAIKFLTAGSYTGLDIIKASIDWCSSNITPRHQNFRFFHEDVHSPLHNPNGTKRPAEVTFPIVDQSADRIILSSVFTHMLPEDIMHYLSKIHQALKPGGLVLTTMFLLNERSLKQVENDASAIPFKYRLTSYEQCRLRDPDVPEGAVAYFEASYLTMLYGSGFELKQPIQYGQWSGMGGPGADGQDYVIFGKPTGRAMPGH
jgi:SAM-dependent methyltransferase